MKRKFLDTISCEKCKTTYDMEFFECPKCHKKNPNASKRSLSNPLLYIDTWREIAILVWGLMFVSVVYAIVVAIYGAIIASNGQVVTSLEPIQELISRSIVYVIIVAGMLYIARKYLRYFLISFTKLRSILFGILGAGLIILFIYLYSLIVSSLNNGVFPTNNNELKIIPMVKSLPALSFFVLVIFGPFVEEMTYRVGLFGLFNKINRYLAYGIAVFIFAIMHFSFSKDTNIITELVSFPIYLVASFILAFLYDNFGFSAAYIAHLLNNLYAYVTYLVE